MNSVRIVEKYNGNKKKVSITLSRDSNAENIPKSLKGTMGVKTNEINPMEVVMPAMKEG
jgi:hypothetical protein